MGVTVKQVDSSRAGYTFDLFHDANGFRYGACAWGPEGLGSEIFDGEDTYESEHAAIDAAEKHLARFIEEFSRTCFPAKEEPNPPALRGVALDLYASVLSAMQRADECGGPDDLDYVVLMDCISVEAQRRARRAEMQVRAKEVLP